MFKFKTNTNTHVHFWTKLLVFYKTIFLCLLKYWTNHWIYSEWLWPLVLNLLKANKQSVGQTNIPPEVIFMIMYRDLIVYLVCLVITMPFRHKQWAMPWTHLASDIRTTGQDIVACFCIDFINFISLSIWIIYSNTPNTFFLKVKMTYHLVM